MKLTIEQMREIVAGAPIGATDYSDEDCEITYYQKTNNVIYWDDISDAWDEVYFEMPELKPLSDLRAAIADHDRTDDVTDIRNHISPNTRVSEAHVNEAYKLNRLG